MIDRSECRSTSAKKISAGGARDTGSLARRGGENNDELPRTNQHTPISISDTRTAGSLMCPATNLSLTSLLPRRRRGRGRGGGTQPRRRAASRAGQSAATQLAQRAPPVEANRRT
eukprot:240317-Prymnesium_polylepis.1